MNRHPHLLPGLKLGKFLYCQYQNNGIHSRNNPKYPDRTKSNRCPYSCNKTKIMYSTWVFHRQIIDYPKSTNLPVTYSHRFIYRQEIFKHPLEIMGISIIKRHKHFPNFFLILFVHVSYSLMVMTHL